MSDKGIMFYVTLSLFGVALLFLAASMVTHAVLGDNSGAPIIFGAVSAVVSIVGIILACVRKKGGENEN